MSSEEEEETDASTSNGDDDSNEYDVMRPKKKPRLLHRRNLRAVKKGLNVDSFNPHTLTSHTEEQRRIERLEHPQSYIDDETSTGSGAAVSSDSTQNGIIVLSDSDNEGDSKEPTRKPYRRQSSTTVKYSESLPLVDGTLVVNLGHPSNEQDIHLPPQIALAVKPHQVRRNFIIPPCVLRCLNNIGRWN